MNDALSKLNRFFKILKNTVIHSLFLAGFCAASSAHAVETVYWVDNQSGVAMAGYDPISYFLRGEGGFGDYHYEYYWSGAVWRFQNEGNLEAFRDYPLIYAPQFGGYDAYKMSSSVKVTPDPYYSDVFNNRLYLFHNQKNLDEWQKKRKTHIRAAQKNWQAMHVYQVFKNFDAPEIEQDDTENNKKIETQEERVLRKMSEIDREKAEALLEQELKDKEEKAKKQ